MLQTLETVVINPILGAGALRDLLWTFANGTLQRIDIITDNPNGGGSTVFDVLINGATIFPGGVGRPSIASGASSANVQGLTNAVVRGDKIRISAATLPAGTVGGKLYIILTFDDALGAGGFSSAPPTIISRAIAAPPGTILEGDAYLIAAGASGAWAGNSGKIAVYTSGAWVYTTPKPEQLVFVEDEQRFIIYKTRNVASPAPVTWILNGYSVNALDNSITKTAVDFWSTGEGHSTETSASWVWRAEWTVPTAPGDSDNHIWSVRKAGVSDTDNNIPTWGFQGSTVGGVPKVYVREVNGASWSYDGSSVSEYFTVAAGNVLAIESDGVNVKYYVGGVLVKTTAHVINAAAHLSCQAYFNGQKFFGAKFYNGTPTAISSWEVLIPRVSDLIPPTAAALDGQVLMYIAGSGKLEWRTISPLVVSGESEQDIIWTGLTTNCSIVSPNTLQTNADWDAVHRQGAQATQSINGVGGYVKFTINGSGESTRYFGLRNDAPNHTASTFKYYLQVRGDGTFEVWQNTGGGLVNVVSGIAYAANDVLAFEAYDDAGVAKVRLTQNGVLRATFTITTIFPMYFDMELPFNGAHIRFGKIRRAA